MAAQLMATKGSAARALSAWMPRANSSLPVPVSPTSKTVTLRLVATWVASAIESRIAALSPITWESQRSADAVCDRAEIVAPFLVSRGPKMGSERGM